MKVSIILISWTPNLIRLGLFKKTLEALSSSTDIPFELIVVNNGPKSQTDFLKTQKIIKIDNLITNEKNMGIGHARNQGMEVATGDYIVFLDNDMLTKKDWLKESIEALEAYPNEKLIGCPVYGTPAIKRKRRVYLGTLGKYLLWQRYGGACWIVRKKMLDEFGKWSTLSVPGRDYAKRVSRAGYKFISGSEIKAFHLGKNNMKSFDFHERLINGKWVDRSRFLPGKIFIDCGGHCGCSIRKFMKERKDANEFKIYSFECNEDLLKYYSGLNVNIISKAAWVENCTKKLYIGQDKQKQGSSLMKEKITNIDENVYREVECIDFPQWLLDNFTEEDYIVLKMNIEGAEYDVLNKMIENGTMEIVKELYIEFHSKRMKGNYGSGIEQNLGIKVRKWNSEKYCKMTNKYIFYFHDVLQEWGLNRQQQRENAKRDALEVFKDAMKPVELAKNVRVILLVVAEGIDLHPEIVEYIKSHPDWEIELHGLNHVRYDLMPEEQVRKDLTYAKKKVEDTFNCKVEVFIPPWLKSGGSVKKICDELGMIITSDKRADIKRIDDLLNANGRIRFDVHYWSPSDRDKVKVFFERIGGAK